MLLIEAWLDDEASCVYKGRKSVCIVNFLFLGDEGKECHTGSAMTKPMKQESQTALIGTSYPLTLCQTLDRGSAPSLEKAYTILTRNTTNEGVVRSFYSSFYDSILLQKVLSRHFLMRRSVGY